MAKGKVSGKTHTQEQLNDWANQNNPNNKAFRANTDNHAAQLNPNRRTHQQKHNAARKAHRADPWVEWAPDYPYFDD